jgi:rod shape-determining protein MreD
MFLPFLLALSAAIFGSIFLPSFHMMAFAPFLALAYMRKSLLSSLWLALFSGIFIDLTTSEMRFGMHALCYLLVTFLLYKQKRHFFDDQPIALSIYTALISALASLILLIFRRIPFTPSFFFTDLFLMPALDAIYAFFWFTCPLRLYHYGKKARWRRKTE